MKRCCSGTPAILGKLHTNEHRYPAEEFRGRFRRPERENDGER
jgi:hypothetical protein